MVLNRKVVANIVLAAGLVLILVLLGLTFNMTSNPVRGDEASHILQTLSLANDFDLKFEERDGKHWKELGLSVHPAGLFFQKYSSGYAFAKPYGYSLFLAPFFILFGANGFGVGNTVIFGLINLFIFLSLRSLYGKLESALLTVSFTFFSYAYMYVFYVHTDMFLAMLSSLFVFLLTRLFVHPSKLYFTALCLVAAFIASEKIPAVLVLLPVLLLYFYKVKSFRTVVGFALIFTAGFLLFIFPYLHYSDYKSWNPYMGKRFYASSSKPFTFDSNKPASSYGAVGSARYFNLSKIIKRTFDTSKAREKISSFYYYFFGAYTGIIVFIPFAFITILYSIFRVLKKPDWQLILPLIGLFSYILFYVVLFHKNYYGGGHSLGNRYFLQIAPFIILLILGLELRRREVVSMAVLSLGLSVMFLHHHHFDPESAYAQIMKSGPVQEMMPFEKNQTCVTHYTSIRKRVNAKLYPSPPKWLRGQYTIELEGRKIVVQDRKARRGKTYFEVVNVSDFFMKTTVNEKSLLVNNGFYHSEKRFIWSKTESTLLLKNWQREEHFTIVQAYRPGTTIKVSTGSKTLVGRAPFRFTIDTRTTKDKWISVRFEADKSGVPSAFSNSGDHRELSFLLAYRKIPRYRKLVFH